MMTPVCPRLLNLNNDFVLLRFWARAPEDLSAIEVIYIIIIIIITSLGSILFELGFGVAALSLLIRLQFIHQHVHILSYVQNLNYLWTSPLPTCQRSHLEDVEQWTAEIFVVVNNGEETDIVIHAVLVSARLRTRDTGAAWHVTPIATYIAQSLQSVERTLTLQLTKTVNRLQNNLKYGAQLMKIFI